MIAYNGKKTNPSAVKSLSKDRLYRMKWEYEIEKKLDPSLLSFGTADMDFPCAEPILDAVKEIIERGHLGYPAIRESYYSSIENWLYRTTGWQINAKECTDVNVGIYTSVWTVLDALTEKGDEVIIQTPVHFCFRQMVEDNGRVVVMNPLKEENGVYTMDFELLEKQFTRKTKLFWLCNPHNPVGRAWNREELERLSEICLRHNVTILSDDVYCGLLYSATDYTPIASLSPEVSQHTVTCYSPSKCYNTTGVKYSFIVAENSDLLAACHKSLMKLDLNYGINIFGLAITEAAYNYCDDWLKEIMARVEKNHAFTTAYLNDNLPGMRVIRADSTYFAWIDIRSSGRPSDELEHYFLKEAHVLLNSGNELGKGGEGFLRMNLACSEDTLQEGLERMKNAYIKLMR